MLPGERFKQWIDGLAESWGDRLRGWMASWVEWGMTKLMESLEPEAIDIIRPILTPITENPSTPQNVKDLINKLLAGTKPLPLLLIIPIAILLFIPTLTSIFQPLGNILRYVQERIFKSSRLDPIAVITAWRRDSALYEGYFDDLKDLGWSPERIEALKFVTEVRPSPQEAISMMAHEAFEEGMVAKYGLDSEFENLDFDYLATIGITKDTAKYHWRGHWQHASFIQVVEMYLRKLITIEDFREWFRVVEIPPFWRDNLIEISHAWPTRVDVRRWWDMRTIDETELRRLYEGMGYHGVNLENYVIWTKVYVAFPDLMARWTKGWITLDEVRSELIGMGMPAERIEELIQTKIEPEAGERVAGERELTKTDIIKGVKKEVISWSEGVELLMDLGFDEDEADYILTINIEAMEGSPESYAEFKAITQKYRKAIRKEAKEMPEELKLAAAELVRVTEEVESLKRAIVEEERTLIPDVPIPEEASAKRDELRLTLHRAEAELQRVKQHYEAKLAEYKFGG